MQTIHPENECIRSEPIRVMHFRASPFLGSPERLLLGRQKRLNPKECVYAVGIFNEQPGGKNDFYEALKEAGASSFLLSDSMVFFARDLLMMTRKIREFRPHLLCTHDYKSNLYGFFLSKRIGIPVLSTFHGITQKDRKIAVYQWIDARILRSFNAILCVSQATRRKLSKRIPNIALYAVPNAVDIQQVQSLAERDLQEASNCLEPETRTVLFAGRLSKEKGLIHLLQAAELLAPRHPKVRFLVLGNGPEEEKMKAYVLKKHLNHSIRFLGYIKNIYAYLKLADFLVLPSLQEGMPVVILEAFALGKAVVASRVGGIPELVQNGVSGILVEPGNAEGLGSAIESLLGNPQDLLEMGKRAYDLVTHYNFEIQAMRYTAVYREILKDQLCESKAPTFRDVNCA